MMKNGKAVQIRIEKSRQLEILSIIAGSGSVLAAAGILFSGVLKTWAGSDSYALMVISYSVSAVLAYSSAVLAYFELKAALEEEEKFLLEKRKEKKALETTEDVLFSASRSLGNYRKYAPYVIALLNVAVIAACLFFFWKYWGRRVELPLPKNPAQPAFVSVMLALLALFGGIFCMGQSREKSFRWLRPAGAWLVLSFLLGTIAAFALIMHKFDMPEWDVYMRKTIFIIFTALAAELLVNFIIDFYRPRTAAEERPVFESRILALFTEPGGIFRNIADTLDYQFGFKVSGTWIYGFIEKSIVPLLMAWLAAFWLFTCISEVGTHELGVRENFGKKIGGTLKSGIYFKLPWPFAKIARYPVFQVQEIVAGADRDKDKDTLREERKNPEVVLWTVEHYGSESRYLVASEKETSMEDFPVSFMSSLFPVQYKIRESGLIDYAYGHRYAERTLKALSEREISKYLASADLIRVMSVDRGKTAGDLKEKIQKAADVMKLGVDIISVNFLDAHPPVEKVAPAFQDVVGAQQDKEAAVLKARAYENQIAPLAEAEAAKIILEAETNSSNTVKLSEAETRRFKKQLQAYLVMPEMFKLRTYLDFFETDCDGIRKVVVGVSDAHNVLIFNLEEKARLDLTEAELGDLSGEVKKEKKGKELR